MAQQHMSCNKEYNSLTHAHMHIILCYVTSKINTTAEQRPPCSMQIALQIILHKMKHMQATR